MTPGDVVLVIGATGNVGPGLVHQLVDEGADTRVLMLENDPNAGRLPTTGVEVFHGDLAVPSSLTTALRGVDSVMLMWPFFTLSVDTVPEVLEKIEKNARRVVFVSSVGVHIGYEHPDDNCHAYLEGLIEKTALEWTFLQTTGLNTNTRMSWGKQIRDTGVVRSPYGDAARSPIHEKDVAAIAVRALAGDGLANRRLVITGPEALTQIEQLDIIGELIGRELRWEDVPPETALEHMVAAGWPPAFARGALEYFDMLTRKPELVTSTVEEVTGKPPRTFRQWAQEHADDFR